MGRRGTGATSAKKRRDRGAPSIIAESHVIVGSVECDGDVHVDGRIDGDVHCRNLTVGMEGCVNGNVNARFVEVLGKIAGSIHARQALIRQSSRVFGEVIHERLVIEPGAVVDGFYRCVEQVDLSGHVDVRNRIGESAREREQERKPSDTSSPANEPVQDSPLPMSKAQLAAKPKPLH